MDGLPRESPGVIRARWLAALDKALSEAQLATWQLGSAGVHTDDAFDLYARLQAAQDEVERLRGGGWRTSRNEIRSDWS
jgi:hypothetical protein